MKRKDTDKKSDGTSSSIKAIYLSIIGLVISLLLGLGAIATLFTGKSDSAGIEFYVLGFLAITILVIAVAIAVIVGIIEIVKSIKTTFQSADSKIENSNRTSGEN